MKYVAVILAVLLGACAFLPPSSQEYLDGLPVLLQDQLFMQVDFCRRMGAQSDVYFNREHQPVQVRCTAGNT